MLGSMRRVLVVLALASGFQAPAPAPRGPPPLHMKKPSPALEAGPLPGLSQTNYNVLIGVTALGVAAPALLAATAQSDSGDTSQLVRWLVGAWGLGGRLVGRCYLQRRRTGRGGR